MSNSRGPIYKRVIKAVKDGKVNVAIKARLQPLKYILNTSPEDVKFNLHCPEYKTPDKTDLPIIERIFKSFQKMKEDQVNAPKVYLPSSLWQDQLDASYSYLKSGLKNNDLDKFHFFLANFGTWKSYTGVEYTTLIHENMASSLRRRYLKYGVFLNQLKLWRRFYNNRKPVSDLTYPQWGNQSGSFINDHFVGVGSFFNEIYGSILSELIRDIDHPVVSDLGAGYGKLGYFVLRNRKSFTFVDFDLPEPLCLAAYYYMKTYPEKKTLLYGEKELGDISIKDYDLIFMPAFEIGKLSPSSVDLFINKSSLGEMDRDTANKFIEHISNATNKYFFHMNHEINPNIYRNGQKGLLGFEYPIPTEKFVQLFRYPDMVEIFYQGYFDTNMDIFMYLYGRRDSVKS